MTAVHVHLTRPQRGTTDRLPAAGLLNVSLFHRQVEFDQYVLVTRFSQVLVDGQATLQLTPTAGGQAWVIEERVPDGRTVAVAVPDTTQVVEYVTLPPLDLATLTPAVDVTAAWTAAAALAVQARDQAYAARDQALTGTPAGALGKTANLSDLSSAGSARTNLGLGDAALHPASDFDPAGAATTAAASKVNSSTYVAGLATKADRWTPNTVYVQGQQVQAPDGSTVAAVTAFTSGSTYNAANWTTIVLTATSVAATYVTYDGTHLLKAGTVITISAASATDNGLGGITYPSGATDNGLGGIAA